MHQGKGPECSLLVTLSTLTAEKNKLNQNDPPKLPLMRWAIVYGKQLCFVLFHSFTWQMAQDIHINFIRCITSQWLRVNLIEEQNVSRLKCCPFPVAYEFLGFHSRMLLCFCRRKGGKIHFPSSIAERFFFA